MKTTTEPRGAAVPGGSSASPPQRWWRLISVSLLSAVFIQAVLAGVMMSGAAWARTAHAAIAGILVASTLAVAVAALLNLRRVAGGRRLAWTMLGLAAALLIQAALGALAARKGLNLLWLHVPLGVALVGFAVQAVARPRTFLAD